MGNTAMVDVNARPVGHWISTLGVGLMIGSLGAMFSISFASLIFSGDLAPYLPAGVGIALFSSIVLRIVVGLMSSYEGVISDIDALPAAIFGLSGTAIAAQMSSSATPDALFSTVIAAIALSTALTGIFLFLLGLFKVGELIRFIPYPVIGGFLAGSGWLLVHGSIQVLTDISLTFSTVADLFQPQPLSHWLAGLIVAVVLLLLSSITVPAFTLPIVLFLLIGLFYLALFLTHTSVAMASAQGWLPQLQSSTIVWQPLTLADLTQVNWSIVLSQWGNMATLMMLCAISVLLNSTGIELMMSRDLNLNRELRAAGLANLCSGLASGMAGYQILSESALIYKMGAANRKTILLATLPFFGAMIAGSSLLSLFPKPILGGLLLFLGLSLLKEWLYDTWRSLPKADYAVIVLILGVMVMVGFLQGIGVGLIVAIALFVISYSQVSVARYALSGASYQSHAARSMQQQRLLQSEGDQIYILELQGFLFFGTANTLLNQIRRRVHESPLKFVTFSFRAVTGLDSSAVMIFAKLKHLAQQKQFCLVFTHLSASLQRQLEYGDILNSSICQVFPDLDRGIEWCENQILEIIPQRRRQSLPLALQLNERFTNPDHVSDFMTYLQEQDLEPGEMLFHQGEPADSLYLIELGQITLQQQTDGHTRRLQSLGAGQIVGEMSFFSKSLYPASAIVDQPSTLYRLSYTAMQQLRHNHPEVAATFQELVIQRLSDRLAISYKNLADLLK